MTCGVCALILAAGSGLRMNLGKTKQRLVLFGESILKRSIRIFNQAKAVDSIIIVARADELDFAQSQALGFEKVCKIVPGGKTRAESARIGFSEVAPEAELVAIHDAARCFVTEEIIDAVVADARKYGAATASTKIYDTVKRVDADMNIISTVNRNELVSVQTPQVCRVDTYKKALSAADGTGVEYTDDNMLLENIGIHPHCTETGKYNIKITTKEDLDYADFLLGREQEEE